MLVDLLVDLLLDLRVRGVDVFDGRVRADLLVDHRAHLGVELADARLGLGDLRVRLGVERVVFRLGLVNLGEGGERHGLVLLLEEREKLAVNLALVRRKVDGRRRRRVLIGERGRLAYARNN